MNEEIFVSAYMKYFFFKYDIRLYQVYTFSATAYLLKNLLDLLGCCDSIVEQCK